MVARSACDVLLISARAVNTSFLGLVKGETIPGHELFHGFEF